MKNFVRATALTIAVSIVPPVGIASTQAVDKPIAASVIGLARRCAPNVHPLTMAYLVAQESSNDRLAINVNGGGSYHPQTLEEAIAIVDRLKREGANYDVGYGQINSGNFAWLNTDAARLFDPCQNLAAAEQVLTHCYAKATRKSVDSQTALRDAFSCYNTGNLENGYKNGYVASVQAIANAHSVPELLPATKLHADTESVNSSARPADAEGGAFASDNGDAFSRSDEGAFANPQDTTAVMGEER